MTRRTLLAALMASLATACSNRRPAAPAQPEDDPIGPIEARLGGRVGLFALDTGSGKALSHRPDERFAMCSTFKWALAAAVLARVERKELALDERVTYGEEDLLEYAPATRPNVASGFMKLEALAEAAVTVSDNTAANLLLARVGGPAGLTMFFRRHGDAVSRLDRDEPTLNTNLPGDPRDTTSPRAMAGLVRRLLIGSALSVQSRERLLGWMKASPTGRERLRAGLPASFVVGDKTGTGANGAVNDVAILWPPGRSAIVVALYLSEGRGTLAIANAGHADIARVIAARLA